LKATLRLVGRSKQLRSRAVALRACARTWAINTIAYSSSLPSQGDVNGDCTIDDADLLAVLFNFGGSGDGDVNSDGVVDDADLLTVLFNFGRSC
jgi:hypothetical protein